MATKKATSRRPDHTPSLTPSLTPKANANAADRIGSSQEEVYPGITVARLREQVEALAADYTKLIVSSAGGFPSVPGKSREVFVRTTVQMAYAFYDELYNPTKKPDRDAAARDNKAASTSRNVRYGDRVHDDVDDDDDRAEFTGEFDEFDNG